MTLQARPRYGNAGGSGRRISDLEEVPVGKADTRREHKGRRAAAGAAIGAGLAHAPVAVSAGAVGAALEGKGNARALRNAATLYRPKHLAHIVSESPKYGAVLGGAALGGAALGAATGKKQPVGKARSFDPEHRRQRRYGMGEAALIGAGGVLGFRGAKGIRTSSRAARSIQWAAKGKPNEADLRAALSQGITARRKDLAQLGGGVAGLGGAAALRQHAESRRGRAWN